MRRTRYAEALPPGALLPRCTRGSGDAALDSGNCHPASMGDSASYDRAMSSEQLHVLGNTDFQPAQAFGPLAETKE
jgi:hypothetical protein